MNAPDPHERYAELAAGHALGALEPADEQQFLAHLPRCAICQRTVAEHVETLGHLAYAVDPVELPPGILEGIRRGVAESGRAALPPLEEQLPSQRSEPATSAPVSLAAARDKRRAAPGRWLISMAAAAALVLSLGVWNVALHRDKSASDQRASQLAAAVKVFESGSRQRVDLAGSDGRPVAVAMVRNDGTVALVVDGLARNDRSASTYVLWQQGERGAVRAMGTFDVTSSDVQVLQHMPMYPALGLKGFAVTREPGRTAPSAPTTAPVAAGAASA